MENYKKLKSYIDKGYGFNRIFPDKVEEVQKVSGMLFSVQDVVDYLQQQTNDFKIENPVASDLAGAIVKLVLKFEKEKEVPLPEPDAMPVDEWASASKELYELLSGDTSAFTEDNINEWKSALVELLDLLELNNYDEKLVKKYKSVL